MEKEKSLSRRRVVAGWSLTALLSVIFSIETISKFAALLHPTGSDYLKLTNYGLDGSHIIIVALGDLATVITFIIPKTSQVALLFLSAQMGAAIATHMEHRENFVPYILVLYLSWFTQWLRNPNTFKFFSTYIKQ